MNVRFEQPAWLWLLTLIVPMLWMSIRMLSGMWRVRAVTVALTRAALLTLLALTLAGATSVRESDRLAVIAVIDVSSSVRTLGASGLAAALAGSTPDAVVTTSAIDAVRDWLTQATREHDPDDLLGVVVFDGAARAVLAPRPVASVHLDEIGLDVTTAQGTNIATAIRLARAIVPPGASARIALVSDGVETTGSAVQAASESDGAPIDVAPIAYRLEHEVLVEFVDAPTTSRAGSVIPVRIGLRSSAPASGSLRLLSDGEPVDLNGAQPGSDRQVTLQQGLNIEIADVSLSDAAVHRFEAFFEPAPGDDAIASNNRGEAITVTPGGGRALIVDGFNSGGGESAAAKELASLFASAGLQSAALPPEATPGDLLLLQSYDLIVLLNVAADELSQAGQTNLATYVSELGGGLLTLGGPKALGAGGWKGTPIEPILPVTLDVPDEVIAPAVAIAFVIDSSGSMGATVMGSTRSQQDIANEATAQAIRALEKRDLVAVYAFDMTTRTVVPIGPNADPETSAQRVLSIAPGGGTNMYPALARAGSALASANAKIKHVIVLSDGQSAGAAATGVETARRLAASGVSVTTIAVGDGADVQTMRAIADAGGGEFYQVIDPLALHRIFIREIRIVRRPLIREGDIPVVVEPVGSAIVAGLPTPTPHLAGLTLSRMRESTDALTPVVTNDGFPVLAHWSVGLGQSAVFTSAPDAWTNAWRNWSGWRAFWTQLARVVARPSDRARGAALLLTGRGEKIHINLEMTDDKGSPRDGLAVSGFVVDPEGSRREVTLVQTAPGRYEGDAPAAGSGVYVAALQPRRGEKRLPAVVGGVTKPVSVEFRRLVSDVGLLERLAAQTGGRMLDLRDPAGAMLFDHRDVRVATSRLPLWPALLPWAIVVALLDIATRRIAWDRLLPSREELQLRADEVMRARSAGAAATTTRLTGRWRALRQRKTKQGSIDEFVAGERSGTIGVRAASRMKPGRESGRTAIADKQPLEQGDAKERSGEDISEGRSSVGSLRAAKKRVQQRFSDDHTDVDSDESPTVDQNIG